MAMQWLEREFRQTGTRQDKLNADLMAAMLEHRGKDIPMPISPVATEAPRIEIVRFSTEAREALEGQGYKVYELTGQTVKSLRDSGKRFWSTWHKGYDFEDSASRSSEVAINPKKLFLPRSNNKTLSEQQALVARFSADISAKVSGVEAVLGEVPDYAELAFAHLDATGDYLFGSKNDYSYTRTQTRVGSDVARVGSFNPDSGLSVDYWDPAYRNGYLFAAPLVVPAGTK